MKSKTLVLLFGLLLFNLSSCQKDDDLTVNSKEELEEKLETEVSSNNLMSISYCVVKNDTILHSGAIGFANEAANKLATDKTRYLIASVSKPVTAVAIMKLVEQNLISLDDDINQKLPFSVRNPNFPSDKITYRMLLSHTSSISDEYQENFLGPLYCYNIDCPLTLAQYCENVFVSTGQFYSTNNFLNDNPGTTEEYSNLGFALLGYLVERISLMPFDEYCKNNIFTPLGMNNTEWRLANTPISEIAIPYDENTNPIPHYTFPDYPNGGLRTNVLDLANFLSMVIENGSFNGTQILTPASMAEMKTLQVGSEFCLSFYYDKIDGRNVLGHSGGESGATAEMFYDTNNNVGVIVFSNEEDAELENIMTLLFNYGDNY
jgi:CubicO group peptidase (beta-lactamase class C family)